MKFVHKIISKSVLFLFLNISNIVFAGESLPRLFLFLGGDHSSSYKSYLGNSCAAGAQIIYSWKQLEPKKDFYDFSRIENDLKFLHRINKKLFIQLQDRSFDPNTFNVPDYIRDDKEYHGGVALQYDIPGEGKPVTTGWVARVWDPAVRKRYQLLIQKLAERFDGKIYGINLPETAVDFDEKNLPEGYSQDEYFLAELKNIVMVRKLFHKSRVIQYVNFFPGEWNNDHQYMSRLFSYAVDHQIGLGGPDVVPYRDSHMNNSYPFFHHLKDRLLIAMAIQEPDYTYINPKTGMAYSFDEFYRFAHDYLGADILFWNIEEPFFSNQLVPKLNDHYFSCDNMV